MTMRQGVNFFSLWQVDPNNAGREHDLFIKLRSLLHEAARYLEVEHEHDSVDLARKTSVHHALAILCPRLGLAAAELSNRDRESLNASLPLLAASSAGLNLLLPYSRKKYLIVGLHQRQGQLIDKEHIAREFSQIYELYAMGMRCDRVDTLAVNRLIKSYMPSLFLFAVSLAQVILIAIMLSALAFIFDRFSLLNELMLLQICVVALVGTVLLDRWVVFNSVKNLPIIMLWVQGSFFRRVFSQSLSSHIHGSWRDSLQVRTILARRINSYFFNRPQVFWACALILCNEIALLVFYPQAALELFCFVVLMIAINLGIRRRMAAARHEERIYTTKRDYVLSAMEASFSMATSLNIQDPLLNRLERCSERLLRVRKHILLLSQSSTAAFWILALLFVGRLLTSHMLTGLNVNSYVVIILIFFDAILVGHACALLMSPDFMDWPLDDDTLNRFNHYAHEESHRVLPVNIEGRIDIIRCSFSYPDSGKVILKNLSLTLYARKFYGISGPSGSGKSTLLKLLMGQVEANFGQIIIDGQDIRSLAPESLRKHFGYVGQSSSLFAGSIKDNVLAGRQLHRRAIFDLLFSHEIFDHLLDMPMGIETYVFAKAENLSRLQIALILLARALVHSPSILFMDEIFTGMSANEQRLFAHFISSHKSTRILISHHSLQEFGCDEIIDLESFSSHELKK